MSLPGFDLASDELAKRPGRDVVGDNKQFGNLDDLGQELQVLEHVVRHRLGQRRRDRERAGARKADRVAVGLCFRDRGYSRHAAGAGTAFDDDRLAQQRRHLLRQHTRDRVGRSARRKRHDQLDRLVGIGLRLRHLRQDQKRGHDHPANKTSHRYFPPMCEALACTSFFL